MNLRGYIFSRPFMNERVPQRVQNLVIRDYCSRNNHNYLLSFTEYAFNEDFYILQNLVNNMKDIDGIIFYSIFLLPKQDNIRVSLINKILKQKKYLFFALEDMKLSNKNDISRIDNIWKIKKNLNNIKDSELIQSLKLNDN